MSQNEVKHLLVILALFSVASSLGILMLSAWFERRAKKEMLK